MRNGEQLTDVYMTAAQTLIQKEFPHLDGLQSPLLRQEDQLLAMVDGVKIHHIDMTSIPQALVGKITIYDSLYSYKLTTPRTLLSSIGILVPSCWLSQNMVKLRVDPHVTW